MSIQACDHGNNNNFICTYALSIGILQILMNVQRAVMAVIRYAKTLMALLSVPVKMVCILAVMAKAAVVRVYLGRKHIYSFV